MQALSMPIQLLCLAMVLALIIERILEIIKSIYDYVDAHFDLTALWTERAKKLRDKLECRLDSIAPGDQHGFDLVMELASRCVAEPDPDRGGLPSVSADKVRNVVTKTRYKILGMLIGVACAWLFNIDILELSRLSMEISAEKAEKIVYSSSCYGVILTGIAMGLGSGPMHKLINALEKARQFRRMGRGQK